MSGEYAIAGALEQNLADLQADQFVIDAKDEMGFLCHRLDSNDYIQNNAWAYK